MTNIFSNLIVHIHSPQDMCCVATSACALIGMHS